MAITTAQGTEIIAGIDTHQDLHTAAIVSLDGTVLGTESFSTTRAGYRAFPSKMDVARMRPTCYTKRLARSAVSILRDAWGVSQKASGLKRNGPRPKRRRRAESQSESSTSQDPPSGGSCSLTPPHRQSDGDERPTGRAANRHPSNRCEST